MLTSCFGLGFMPFASGTWGSIPAALIFALVCILTAGYGVQLFVNTLVMALIAIAGSVICVRFSPDVISLSGRKDPGEIVIDELAGQAVTYMGAYAYGGKDILIVTIAGFLLFRFFDISKFWPINKLEKLPAGWGILADDILAGIFAAISLNIGLYLYHSGQITNIVDIDGKMTAFAAILLGSVQGFTEFLPVSSSGHLVMLEHILGFAPHTPQMLIFDLIVHVGTVFAILLVFRESIAAFVKNLTISRKYGKNPIEIYKKSPSVHFLVLAVVSTLITFVVAMGFGDYFEAARGEIWVVGVMWFVTATLLLITDYKTKTRMSLRQMGFLAAVVIGLAQAGAIMPGISRSGATICAAVLLGLHRRWAIEYSFLLAMPAILGGTVITLLKDADQLKTGNITTTAMILGALSAFIVGIIALRLLISFSRRKNFKIFALYCYLLSIAVAMYYIFGKLL